MRVVSLTGATHVVDPVHGEHHAGPDGVFELPQQVADHLTRTAAGMWRGEADHMALLARESFDELLDPRVALRVLSELRERVGALEAQVAELRAPQAPAEDDAGVAAEDEPESEDDGAGGNGTEDPRETDAVTEEAEEVPAPASKRRPGTDRPPRVRKTPGKA